MGLPFCPKSNMATSDFYMFTKLKSHHCVTQYGSKEGVIEAVHRFFGDQEKVFYFGLNFILFV